MTGQLSLCVHVLYLPSRGGAFQAVSPVREDFAPSHQTSQRRAGTQVQPKEQTCSSTLPLPEKQTRRLLYPHSAGKSHILLPLFSPDWE